MLVKNYYRALNQRIESLSEESKVFFMVDMHAKHIRVNESTEVKSINEVVNKWTQYIMLAVVSGYMGKGKTDFSLKVAEWLWLDGNIKHIVGNIRVNLENSIFAPYYYEVSTLSELILHIYKHRNETKAFIFDEASIHISHRKGMSSNNMTLIHLAKLIRKLKCHFIIISQRPEGIDKDLRELMTLHIHKESKNMAFVRELYGDSPETYYIDDITQTKIPFDTLDPADFIFDIKDKDMPEIMRAISKNMTYDKFEKVIIELVNKNKKKDEQKQHEYINEGAKAPNEKGNEYIKGNEKGNEKTQHYSIYQCETVQKRTNVNEEILMYISDRGQVRLQEVMKFINKSKTRTYEIIEGLVRKGLVYRNGKGRNTTYQTTDAGEYCIKKN
jgi:predicted transcriptional regulator